MKVVRAYEGFMVMKGARSMSNPDSSGYVLPRDGQGLGDIGIVYRQGKHELLAVGCPDGDLDLAGHLAHDGDLMGALIVKNGQHIFLAGADAFYRAGRNSNAQNIVGEH